MLLAFDWTQLAQQTMIGLASGGIWATLALALVLIYRSTGVVNFAQGEMAMFSTFIAWSLVHHGLSYWASFFLTIAISFVGGVAVERAVIRPVDRAPVLTVVIVTLGLFFLVNGAARWIWSPETRTLPNAFSTRPIDVAGVAFSIQDLGNIAVSLAAVVLLWLFFRFTKLGLAARAAAVNPDASRLVGVRVSWMLALGWGLAAAMGAISGMLTAPALASFDQNLMQPVLLYAFAGAVLGGIESPLGAVVGSLLLGVFVNLIGTYVDWIGNALRLPVALAVILGVLLVRPGGLFGRAAARRV
jgi:branched-chain amino acid transport system permease protein